MAVVDRALASKFALGASEGAAVLGLGPYQSASDVWLRKVGLGAERGDTGPMRAGRALEVPILRMTGELAGVRFSHNTQTFAHPRFPDVPLFATPDGFGPRRHVGAEVKLVGYRFADWAAGVPEYVAVQAHLQMACLPSLSRVIVGALLGSELRTYTIERDVVLEDQLAFALVEWWQTYIVGELAPPADTPAASWRLAKATASTDGRQARLATPDEQRLGETLLGLNASIAAAEKQADDIRRELAAAAATSDVTGTGWVASWRSRADVSWKAVATDAGATPELVEQHTRRSSSFAFRSAAAAAESD